MSRTFDPETEFVPAVIRLAGPLGYTVAIFALDTGANRSLVSRDMAVELGYDLAAVTSFSSFITGSGIETAPRVNIERLEALGQERRNFPMVCHNLPEGTPFDGLLGLDFLRGQKLTIDFHAGLVTLE